MTTPAKSYSYRGNGKSLPPGEASARLTASPPPPAAPTSSAVHVSRLSPHPANVREDLGDLTELAASIREHGILQPIVVQPAPLGGGRYMILAGHRRFEAAKKAGLTQVPVTIREEAEDTGKVIEMMLVENCQRRDLSTVEKAEAMGALRNRGLSAAEIGRRTGLAGTTVSYYLSLLDLDEASLRQVRDGQIKVGEAVEAVRLARQRARKRTGRAQPGATWEPDHFAARHPLAQRAASMCDMRGHTMRRRVGKIACGACWETVIRADEAAVQKTLAAGQP